MPRKIPDLKDTLLICASEMFLNQGYACVNMRQIAANAGTSVGNLYNYFPTKKDLFLAARRYWMEGFEEKLNAALQVSQDPKKVLQSMMELLIRIMIKWGNLWEEFWAVTSKELTREETKMLFNLAREELKVLVIEKMDSLLRKIPSKQKWIEKLLEAPEHRFASSLISIVHTMCKFYPNSEEANKKFINDFLSSLFQEQENL